MEDVRELRDVLERVEGKLIAAGKMYGAMSFAVWLVILMLYYVLLAIMNPPWQFNVLYWPVAFALAMKFSGEIWKRFTRLAGMEGSRKDGIKIALVWSLGFVLGWIVVPAVLNRPVDTEIGLALLTFISFSVGGMFLVAMRSEKEVIPAFLVPALLIPIAYGMEAGTSLMAGFGVGLGYSITVLLYLYSAFRAIER